MKFATKRIEHCPPHLKHVATLPREMVKSKFGENYTVLLKTYFILLASAWYKKASIR